LNRELEDVVIYAFAVILDCKKNKTSYSLFLNEDSSFIPLALILHYTFTFKLIFNQILIQYSVFKKLLFIYLGGHTTDFINNEKKNRSCK
jgi:hypothetical protein